MNFAEERAAIESRFSEMFTAAPIAWENVAESAELQTAKGSAQPWVRLSIRNGDSLTSAIGGATGADILAMHQGRIWVQVFVAEGTGTQMARQMADTARDVYRQARFSGIKCYEPSMSAAGVSDGWYQVNVSVPYRRYSL